MRKNELELVSKIANAVQENHNIILAGASGMENARLAQETAAALLGYTDADGMPDVKALEAASKGPKRQYLYYRVEPCMRFEDFAEWLRELAKGLRNRAAKTAAALQETLPVAAFWPEKVVFTSEGIGRGFTFTPEKEYDVLECIHDPGATYYKVKGDTGEEHQLLAERMVASPDAKLDTSIRPVEVMAAEPGDFVVVIDGLDQVDWMMAPLPPPSLSEQLRLPKNAFFLATMAEADLEHSGVAAFWQKQLTWLFVQIDK